MAQLTGFACVDCYCRSNRLCSSLVSTSRGTDLSNAIVTGGEEERQWTAFFASAKICLDAAEAADQELRLRIGSAFSVFDWIRPGEVRLSAILRDILDPQGSHGQGNLFLRLALEELFELPVDVEPSEFGPVTIIAEAPIDNGRRIDLLIKFDSPPANVAIENKPWAAEGESQLEAYSGYLQRKYREGGSPFCLIFLHGPGIKPRSINPERRAALEKDGRFQTIPYYSSSGRCLHSWLVRCAETSHSDKLRWFLRDFADYVAKRFEPNFVGEE